jgi:hypothetical protein
MLYEQSLQLPRCGAQALLDAAAAVAAAAAANVMRDGGVMLMLELHDGGWCAKEY